MSKTSEAGFSYIDVMIAVAILLIGVMALVGAITNGINMTTRSQEALAAKQVASSTVEAIFTARDLGDANLGWAAIGNVGDAAIPGAVFLAGKQNIYPTPGKDGIVGTADDGWGADGIQGNSDDGQPAIGMQREIKVTDLVDPDRPTSPITLRQIDVIIYYSVGAIQRQETFTSYIANYRVKV